jgi:hypothetical protein
MMLCREGCMWISSFTPIMVKVLIIPSLATMAFDLEWINLNLSHTQTHGWPAFGPARILYPARSKAEVQYPDLTILILGSKMKGRD